MNMACVKTTGTLESMPRMVELASIDQVMGTFGLRFYRCNLSNGLVVVCGHLTILWFERFQEATRDQAGCLLNVSAGDWERIRMLNLRRGDVEYLRTVKGNP